MTRDSTTRPNAVAAARASAAAERMPVLRSLVAMLQAEGFRFPPGVGLFGVQHLMEQALGLGWALNALGLPYARIALCGKPYSSDPTVMSALDALGVMVAPAHGYSLRSSQRAEQIADLEILARRFKASVVPAERPPVLVLDDGGVALAQARRLLRPQRSFAGVEQTASGFWQEGVERIHFPVVDVAASALKRQCEPPVVIDAAMRRVRRQLDELPPTARLGVAGLGHIGAALARHLCAEGRPPATYDPRPDGDVRGLGVPASSVEALFEQSDVVFGCSGVDITAVLMDSAGVSRLAPGRKTLISLSSGDEEFFSLKAELLRGAGAGLSHYDLGAIPDIVGRMDAVDFVILRNGFPINFDNSAESASLEEIQGTIAALLGALCQASQYLSPGCGSDVRRVMLDVGLQDWLIRRWPPLGQFAKPMDARDIVQLSAARTAPISRDCGGHFGDWTRA